LVDRGTLAPGGAVSACVDGQDLGQSRRGTDLEECPIQTGRSVQLTTGGEISYPTTRIAHAGSGPTGGTSSTKGKISRILCRARAYLPTDEAARKLAELELGYFEDNRTRMQYQTYRKAGLFVGSGVVEAGCKTVIGLRLKRSGMEWSVRGANAILALRCNLISDRFEDYWEQRVA
jgi:hypothetical protein